MTKPGGFVIYMEDWISRIELIFYIHFVLKSTKADGELTGEHHPRMIKEICAWPKRRLTRQMTNRKNQKLK
jgi:hypothetical protein